ncbi:MAG: hypothetical protein OXB92_07650 [Acidimicrobiaceae bacterium]|nr:hypothetical protein [Acidimicrobiia bacterium]MCY4493711.1 hypothetical protein [Acidimicrobiaceae bacterium]
MTHEVGYLPRLASWREFVDYMEGHPVPSAADVEYPDTGRKLVKTYVLETAGSDRQMPDLASRFAGRVRLQRLDDTLNRVEDADHNGEVAAATDVVSNALQSLGGFQRRSRDTISLSLSSYEEQAEVVKFLEQANPADKMTNLEAAVNEAPRLFDAY